MPEISENAQDLDKWAVHSYASKTQRVELGDNYEQFI